jgi:hypothetical protein
LKILAPLIHRRAATNKKPSKKSTLPSPGISGRRVIESIQLELVDQISAKEKLVSRLSIVISSRIPGVIEPQLRPQ